MIDTDVVVIGGGAAGLTAAVAARKLGLDVLVVEKTAFFGGTTAYSGGAPWFPNNHVMKRAGLEDSREAVELYLHHALGERYDDELIGAFLDNAPAVVAFMEENSEVRFKPSAMPDYLSDLPGAAIGRTLFTCAYDGRLLADDLTRLRPPLPQLVMFGSMQIEGADIHPLRKAFKSSSAFWHAAKLMARFVAQKLMHGRGMRLTAGNALAARLLKSARDSGAVLWTHASVVELVQNANRVSGVMLMKDGEAVRVEARCGVLLATGGFGANEAMRATHVPFPEHHFSLQPEDNVGDGIRLGTGAGGVLNTRNVGNCIWVPVSTLKRQDGSLVKYPHIFIDRYMPGCIAVDDEGKRFVNEGDSYQTFVNTMHRRKLTTVHLIADRKFLRAYGLGLARPFPFRSKPFVEAGYLVEAPTLRELAAKIAVDPASFEKTVETFNAHARRGVDPDFGRGTDVHSRYRGDATHKPNPSLGVIESGPFYALAVHPGDLGTVTGLNTNGSAQVLDRAGEQIPGLYAAGIDMNSMVSGMYPSGGMSLGPAMTFAYIAVKHMHAGAGRPRAGVPDAVATAD